jgi:GNAT superfamily N-acetyltransferase
MTWPSLSGDQSLGACAPLFAAVVKGFHAGQAECTFDADRPPPTGGENVVWIGEVENPDAFATFYDGDMGRVWLGHVYVHPAKRKLGHGTWLVAAVKAWAEANGFKSVTFATTRGNGGMRRIGGTAGFTEKPDVYYTLKLDAKEGR